MITRHALTILLSLLCLKLPGASHAGSTSISVGTGHACAVVAGGVWCWGTNVSGQFGDGTVSIGSNRPVNVFAAFSGATGVATGNLHTCAVIQSGLKCWGKNDKGQLGTGDLQSRLRPVDIFPPNSGVTKVSSAGYLTCAVVLGGVKCWGTNQFAGVGDGTTLGRVMPVDVIPPNSGVSELSVGYYSACAVQSGGLKCWGEALAGLGIPLTHPARNSELQVLRPAEVIPAGSGVTRVSITGSHGCALVSGSLWCWGSNKFGELGNDLPLGSTTPTALNISSKPVAAVAAGEGNTCYVADGGLQCSGDNRFGMLGDGTTTDRRGFADTITRESEVTDVSIGATATCAIKARQVWCWGGNIFGEVGAGTDSTFELLPKQVAQNFLIGPDNYQGVWWGGQSENGWGVSLIQHGPTLAVGWYYFNDQVQPVWALVPGCSWDASFTVCSGNVVTSTGAWLGNYNSAQFQQTTIGSASFTFSSNKAGVMTWNIGGVPGTKNISRLNYASGASPSGIDYSDIWWGGQAQNGWGLAIGQQGGVFAGVWYTYTQAGQPVWYLINGGSWTSTNTYSGPLSRATGSPLIGATYNAALFNPLPVGTVSITFTDAANGRLTYTVDGVTQNKPISRLAF